MIYLIVVGRGSSRKLAAGALMSVVLVLSTTMNIVVWLVAGYPTWLEVLGYAIELIESLLVIAAWGLARRSGAWWTVAIPIGIAMWALMNFVIIKLPVFTWSSDDEPSFLIRNLSLPVWILVELVIPIMIGWGLELLTRGSGGGGAGVQQYGRAPSRAPMYGQAQSGGAPQYGQTPQHGQMPQYGQRPSWPPQNAPYPQQGPPRY